MIGKIFIKDLSLQCTIGITAEEKNEKTTVVVNVTLWTDLTKSVQTDVIEDTVSYSDVYRSIRSLEKEEYNLLETLTKRIVDLCLEDKRIVKVKVSTEKPNILKACKSAGVELEQEQS